MVVGGCMNKKDRYHEVVRKRVHRNNIKSCENKKRYSDINQAIAGAMRTIECIDKITKMYYYKCNECHGYHLTKQKSYNNFPCEV